MARESQRNALIRVAAALIASLLASPVDAGVLFGPVINPQNGHAYYLLDVAIWDYAGFAASEAEAQLLGGHLVTIDNAAEDLWVFTTFGSLVGQPAVLGIGLNDIAVEGVYEWIDGSPVTYTNWDPSPGGIYGPQPDGSPDDVVGIALGIFTPGKWHDFNTDPNDLVPPAGVFPVVEVRAVPEPNTFTFILVTGAIALAYPNRRFSRCCTCV